MGVDIIDQSRCIFAHFEEICLFFCRCNRASAVRTFSVYELGLGEEGFTRCTVKTFVISFVDISLIVQFFEDFLYLCLVIGVGGTDEFVVGRIHQIPDSLDLGGYVVYEFFWRDTCLFCFQLDLLAMLIGSGLEEYIILEFFIIQFSFSFVLRVEGHEHSIHFRAAMSQAAMIAWTFDECRGRHIQ